VVLLPGLYLSGRLFPPGYTSRVGYSHPGYASQTGYYRGVDASRILPVSLLGVDIPDIPGYFSLFPGSERPFSLFYNIYKPRHRAA